MADNARLICDSAALVDGGAGVRFALDARSEDENGFAVRYRGKVCAFVNRCPHMGTQLDWQPGEFFDISGLYLVCATHGAIFEPRSGSCVAGPCRGAALEPVRAWEDGGRVFVLDHTAGPANKDERQVP